MAKRKTARSKRNLTLAQAEKRTKRAAKKRRITLELTPEQMAAFLRREQDRYGSIIKNAGIKIEN